MPRATTHHPARRHREVGMSDLHHMRFRSRWETTEASPDTLAGALHALTARQYLGDDPDAGEWERQRCGDPAEVKIARDGDRITVAALVTYSWFDREPRDCAYEMTVGDLLAGRWSLAARKRHRDGER